MRDASPAVPKGPWVTKNSIPLRRGTESLGYSKFTRDTDSLHWDSFLGVGKVKITTLCAAGGARIAITRIVNHYSHSTLFVPQHALLLKNDLAQASPITLFSSKSHQTLIRALHRHVCFRSPSTTWHGVMYFYLCSCFLGPLVPAWLAFIPICQMALMLNMSCFQGFVDWHSSQYARWHSC